MARPLSGHVRQSSLFDANDASKAGTGDDHLKLSREVQVIKRYLERSNDVNTAAACFRTLVRVTSAFDIESHFMAITHLLETLAVALDVLCNHCRGVDPSTRTDMLDFVNKLHPFFSIEGPYFDFAFLLKRIQSAIAFSVECSSNNDAFGGLVFDIASILLSHHNYDLLKCVDFLECSHLGWYSCWQIIKSLLAQHPDFSRVPDIPDGPVYSILDINTALEKLASICPPREAEEDIAPPDRLTRLDLLRYCVLVAAQQMLPEITQPPRRGFLKLSETILGTDIPPELYFKSMVLLCELQSAVDSLLRLDTFGEVVLEELDLKATLNLRAVTSRLLSQVSLSQVSPLFPNGGPSGRPSAGELAKRKVKRAAVFRRQIASSKSSELGAEGAHLALIELDDIMAKRDSPLAKRVRSYFEENDLDTLLCPISERPMTDAVYLRCGKTVSKAALLELIAGNIPANHCCCEDIHDDIQHILHDSPLISDLAVRHLSQVLHVDEVIQYGDLKALQKMYIGVQDENEMAELLHLAITCKNSSAVEFLLQGGVDPNVPRNGKLPLVRAASLGLDDVITALLDRGADAAALDAEGKSALAHAAHNGHQSVVELLFFSMSNIPFDAAVSDEMDLPPEDRGKCAAALHDLWQAFKESRAQDAILYLQRAMELDPENHVYAEEMQAYLDDEDERHGAPRVHTSVVDDEGHLYDGFLVGGIRTGTGKLTYSQSNEDLESFDGEWLNNVKQGGLLVYRDGSQYHGDVSMDDKRHGQGILYLPGGASYEGAWVQNKMHGVGKYCFENGDVYQGSFENDNLSGPGKLIHANGDYYDGEWRNGFKHGYGTYDLRSKGLKYEGFWKNDKKQGSGELFYPDGSRYKGEFIDDDPVVSDSVSSDERRRRSTGYRTLRDRGSSGSAETELGSAYAAVKGSEATLRKSKHERSRSFVETVGRRIEHPQV